MNRYRNIRFLLTASISICIALFSYKAKAQPNPPPNPYPSGTQVNFIRIWDATAPEQDPNTLMTRPLKDVKMATQYFDGLGKLLQTVVKQGSLETNGSAVDMVSPNVYDIYGRERYKYLPFAANNTGNNTSINDGLLKLNPFQQQATFMQAQYGTGLQGETYYYGETVYDNSPLNRVQLVTSAGNWWVGRGIGTNYLNNTATDDVKKWVVTNVTNGWGTYSINSNDPVYSAGTLFKMATTDENGNEVIEFKDKEGKVILKKVQLTATWDYGNGSGYPGWLCTYYIYDDLNNLRCVVQPKGVELLIANNWDITSLGGDILNEQCFRYEYDGRNRMIRKKVPGAGEVYMVYDAKDRLVMTQDANLRAANKWLVTLYDNLNRPELTGLLLNTWNGYNYTFLQHLTNADASGTYPFTSSTTPSTTYWEEMTRTFYDNYDWRNQFPNSLSNYYDNSYDTYFQTASNNNFPYPQANSQTSQLNGLVTGTRIKVIGTSTYLFTVNFYDQKARLIQVHSQNITGGIDIATTQYTWAGQPLIMITKTEKFISPNQQTTIVVTQMTYDDLGRLSKTEKKLSNTLVNGNTMSIYKTILQNEYDKLGQLKKKKLAPDFNSGTGLESLTYDYNIRGWLLGVNRDYATGTTGPSYFGFSLGYDKTTIGSIGNFASQQFNGNIAGMVWKSKGSGEIRKYDFGYDAANRILKADFTQFTNGFNLSAGINFSMQMGNGLDPNLAYDANGNIKAMKQFGWKLGGNTTTPIDDLAYTYCNNNNSNKLLNVIDAQNDPNTKLGDFRSSQLYMTALGGTKTNTAVDYTYDDNGNMQKDRNKDMGDGSNDGIVYNYLNLPQTVTVRTTGGAIKGVITYTYDAAGNKIKKEVNETGQPLKTTLYLGGEVFESDILQFVAHEEGRIRPSTVSGQLTMVYDYFLKDHLGNIRMVLTEEQKTDQYPAATMETANATVEETYYANLPQTRMDVPNGYPSISGNYKVAKVRGDGNKIGPAITLRVMAGDKINLIANAWYDQNSPTPGTPVSPLNDLIGGISNGIGNITGTHGGATITEIQNSNVLPSNITSFLNGRDQFYNSSYPKAYLNWILFDEQFKYDASSSGYIAITPPPSELLTLSNMNIPMNKNGYLYIYVSNETPNIDVFFDNLQVTHIRGPLTEETHYYPFGLTMNGISSKALSFGTPENKRKWNVGSELANKEFSDGSGLELYETFYRSLDPQIGRFWQIDPEIEAQECLSTYESMGNNPISDVDPLGDFKTKFGAKWHRFWHGGGRVGQNEYGEWYVTKNRGVEVNDKGEVIVKSAYYYGKGRNKYSSAIEAFLKDVEIQNDIMHNGGKVDETGQIISTGTSMYQMYDSPKEAGNATLGYTNLLLPNTIIKPSTIAINGQKVVEKIKIIFGNNPNQVYHAFRHIDEMGLSRTVVQSAIEEHLPTVVSKIVEGKPLNQVIEVAGKKIQYTAFKLSDGTINVGRIHGVN